MKRLPLITLILLSINSFANAEVFQEQSSLRKKEFLTECKNNKKFLNTNYNIQCELNYHHYNSSSYKNNYDKSLSLYNEKVKIAEFNVLHPGTGKSRFKDYIRVAKIMNQYDVVGVTELIPLVEDDLKNNNAVISFLKDTPKLIKEINKEIKSLTQSIAHSRRSTITKKRRLALIKKQKIQLQADLADARSLYRTPGYLKILDALHLLKDGKDWALIISPQGEGSKTTPTPELVGYFYRSTKVKPKVNKYCEDLKRSGRLQGKATPVACIVQMDREDMGEDKRDIIARRPFLAEFISGNFSFTLITSHVLFEEPSNKELQKNILRKAFDVDHYKDLKVFARGASKDKYARFAEVKLALDFINHYLDKYNSKEDIIYMGDLNLEKQNPFWSYILQSWEGSKIFIDGKTSMSFARYNGNNTETLGGSSNYDHFIFDPNVTDECSIENSRYVKNGIFNFTQGSMASYINRSYLVRNNTFIPNNTFMSLFKEENGYYEKNDKKYKKAIKKFVEPKTIGTDPILTIGKVNIFVTEGSKRKRLISKGIIVDRKATQEYAEKFKERVLDSQFLNSTYYYMYQQLVSDHYPISISCDTN